MPCEDDQRSKDELWAAGNQPRLTMLQAYREDVRREWPFKGGMDDALSSPEQLADQRSSLSDLKGDIRADLTPRKSRPGAKPKWDWDDVELFVREQLDSKGDYEDVDPTADWKRQSDLIASVMKYIERRSGGGTGPSDSTMKARIAPMVDRWRASRNSADN